MHVSREYDNPRAPYYRTGHYHGMERAPRHCQLAALMGRPAKAGDRAAIVAELQRNLRPAARATLNGGN